VEEVANVAAWLASGEASYVTGQQSILTEDYLCQKLKIK